MTKLLPFEEAQRQLIALAQPLEADTRSPVHAVGRYLAEPMVAQRTQPAADLSAMDGYAISGEGPWRLTGESRAGNPFEGALADGDAVRISTGALMPSGSDRVLIQENAEIDGDVLTATGGIPTAGRHVRRKGFDFNRADKLLDAGVYFGPAQLALALAANTASLKAHRKPRIAIIDSGDELSAAPDMSSPHQIPASNGSMIAAMVRDLTSDIMHIGPIPDRLDALEQAFNEAGKADVIVTSGGASVGDHDLIRPALEAWGANIAFWRIAIRPGKPLLVAQRGEQIILGLPGNPVSSFVTAQFFLLPLLRALAGASRPFAQAVGAALSGSLMSGGPRLHFVRAVYDQGRVTPIDEQDSSALGALSLANALIERPVDCPTSASGDEVQVYLLENGRIA
ncbi:molybdopterin molybdotransferase MoeA [Altererythrobacter sp. ZODW24]|uniref:molybdopterin molybdotransferase MoeA n=1 Tax=Altererythrobacter sp. ZODW24 TaxID=2185142 RepID=UPI000DF72662|nr:molybdopterin molybdotransferase MoeA [Altererythrobacter sp. ZODW24]